MCEGWDTSTSEVSEGVLTTDTFHVVQSGSEIDVYESKPLRTHQGSRTRFYLQTCGRESPSRTSRVQVTTPTRGRAVKLLRRIDRPDATVTGRAVTEVQITEAITKESVERRTTAAGQGVGRVLEAVGLPSASSGIVKAALVKVSDLCEERQRRLCPTTLCITGPGSGHTAVPLSILRSRSYYRPTASQTTDLQHLRGIFGP
ncbi:hypothetical protein J6590_033494 [Homalodisca vitripennis]|nr:hypothetical protein J6590_033494 [Homalodisca vitripennis]